MDSIRKIVEQEAAKQQAATEAAQKALRHAGVVKTSSPTGETIFMPLDAESEKDIAAAQEAWRASLDEINKRQQALWRQGVQDGIDAMVKREAQAPFIVTVPEAGPIPSLEDCLEDLALRSMTQEEKDALAKIMAKTPQPSPEVVTRIPGGITPLLVERGKSIAETLENMQYVAKIRENSGYYDELAQQNERRGITIRRLSLALFASCILSVILSLLLLTAR